MNKVFATALSFGAILLLAGCKPQFSPSKAKGIDSESWKTVIPESCQSFFDGCNQCTKTADGEAACTEMYCEKYDTPKCLDDENS